MGFFDLFKKETRSNVPLLTPEQQQAQRLLLDLGRGGEVNGLRLGEEFTGSLGDFALTDLEREAAGGARDLLRRGTPQSLTDAESALQSIVRQGFDRNDPALQAARREIARFGADQENILNREAAITGDRFSTAIGREKGLLAERLGDIGASTVANLFNQAQGRAVSAAGTLGNLALSRDANARANQLSAAGFGALERDLRNAEAQAQLREFNRQRNEKLGRIDVLQGLFNRGVPFGELNPSANVLTPFGSLVNSLAGVLGGRIGGNLFGSLGGLGGGAPVGSFPIPLPIGIGGV